MNDRNYADALTAHSHAMEVRASRRDAVTTYHKMRDGIVESGDQELARLELKLQEAEQALDEACSNVNSYE